MSEFWEPKIKVCKVDIKVLLQNCWVGPPNMMQHQTPEDQNPQSATHSGRQKIYIYEGPFSTPTADSATAKLRWNSVLYTPDGKYLIFDFKNFYLKNPTNKAEYLKKALKILPQYIIDTHDLISKQ